MRATFRARLIASATCRWCLAQFPEIRLHRDVAAKIKVEVAPET